MNDAPVTLDALIAAFTLPPGPAPRRVPKASLADNVPTTSDRRLIEAKLARLDWIAAINPATAGIAAAMADGMDINTINLLAARTRGAMPTRLIELIHRAIPQPVILAYAHDELDAPASLSLAAKRAAEREAGRVVVTALHDTGTLDIASDAFLAELTLSRLPHENLPMLYAGLIDRVDALAAARARGRPFRMPESLSELAQWRAALAQIREIETEIAGLSAVMRKEARLAARVERGEAVRQLRSKLDNCHIMLD